MADWCALFVAVVALVYAVRESRLNHSVVVKVLECGCGFPARVGENNAQHFAELRVIIRNAGVSLHSPTMTLAFSEPDGFGSRRMPLKNRGEQGESGEFSKGMVTEFSLKSYELNEQDCAFLSALANCRNQNARLCIFSNRYLAKSIRVGGIVDRFKSWWNQKAYRFNSLFDRRVPREGDIPGIRTYKVLPQFITFEFAVTQFIDHLKRAEKRQSP
jgi:hypothetical protein